MTALGPQLAEALGGTWDDLAGEVVIHGDRYIWISSTGRVWFEVRGVGKQIGTFSDGVEALAAKAREMGATCDG